ncbi:MAG: hypothetical protein AAGC55_09120 [Myxococcota bacterium]
MTRRISLPWTPLVGALGLALCAVASVGCERPRAPLNGLAGFSIGQTTRASVENKGRCYENPDAQAWRCLVRPVATIAGRSPDVQLDFDSMDMNALLTEITLTVPGCKFADLNAWLDERLGAESRSSAGAKHAYWTQQLIFVAAGEISPARCQITAVKSDDQPRISALKQPPG